MIETLQAHISPNKCTEATNVIKRKNKTPNEYHQSYHAVLKC